MFPVFFFFLFHDLFEIVSDYSLPRVMLLFGIETFRYTECYRLMWREVWVFPGGLVVKNPPDKQEMRVWSLGQEDPLEEEVATHPSILAWEIPWTKEPGRLQPTGSQRVVHDLMTEHACLGVKYKVVTWEWSCVGKE